MKPVILCIAAASGFLLFSCHRKETKENSKAEIINVERSFQQSLVANGVAFAFHQFAADSAVIKRENDTLIIGKEAIRKYYSHPMYNNARAEWHPDFVDVSDDGSMAYTYGNYEWTFADSSGTKSIYKGVFHTVWKKMDDGHWKYVWD